MRIVIRKSTQSDIPWVRKRLTEMWIEHARHERGLLSERLMRSIFSPARYRKQLRNKKTHTLIAEVDGQIAGYLKADETRIASFFRRNRILFLDEIYVDRKFRRRGIARRLLREAERLGYEIDEEVKRNIISGSSGKNVRMKAPLVGTRKRAKRAARDYRLLFAGLAFTAADLFLALFSLYSLILGGLGELMVLFWFQDARTHKGSKPEETTSRIWLFLEGQQLETKAAQ